eukprot:c4798_g1_i1.p1 GENE.c4798_g1_i1~~c4798_g1_i1.p1  ORF type:complete len:120 (+),score=27.58 c4798_g1_i1:38-397(+)
MLIYHLCGREEWSGQDGYLPPTYHQDGFIHAANSISELVGIANHFYKQKPGDFIVLCIDVERLTSEVKFEAAAPVGNTAVHTAEPKLFPHIYGPLNKDAVVQELNVQRAEDGTFLQIDG